VALARADGARLEIVHVMTPPSLALPADGYVSPQLYTDLEASARAQARKRLDAVVARARKAGVRAGGLLLEGVPHERIVRAARARKADLLARFFLGSVAARLISSASVPVLTVRGRG
jgi:nucleotide-binding universal stress UspA family protein